MKTLIKTMALVFIFLVFMIVFPEEKSLYDTEIWNQYDYYPFIEMQLLSRRLSSGEKNVAFESKTENRNLKMLRQSVLHLSSASQDQTANESGKIMIHMFHHFIERYERGDKKNTILKKDFIQFLEKTYALGYRPITMQEFMDHNISLPAGLKPMVLSFDDGWNSQFSLIQDANGNLSLNPNCAVYLMQEFQQTHPDFHLKGIFYVNLALPQTFEGEGNLKQRLQFLMDLGFEIGNHGYRHKNLKKLNQHDQIKYEIGENEKVFKDMFPDQKMVSFSYPYGSVPANFLYLTKNTHYEGIFVDYPASVLAGASPSYPPGHIQYDPYKVPRILTPGIHDLKYDSNWWLDHIKDEEVYVSDGNPLTITIPKNKKEMMVEKNLQGKRLIIR